MPGAVLHPRRASRLWMLLFLLLRLRLAGKKSAVAAGADVPHLATADRPVKGAQKIR